jgi:ubiquinone biosynthesis protein
VSDVESFGRLVGAAWVLVRADAILPRELEPVLPPSVRLLARTLRLFAGSHGRKGRPGQRLAKALETLGPAAIKLGQVLSTRADIFGVVFAEDLARLKDRLAPFSMDTARALVAEGLGQPVDSLFSEFGPPLAAASLAQAHPARLMDGRKVAVKVLRPGIERRVTADIRTMHLAARIADGLGPEARRLDPRGAVAAVARSLELELDMRLEAAGCSELGEIMAADADKGLAGKGGGYMRAPQVVWQGVGKRVLTLTWAEGMPLSDPAALEQPGLDRPALANNLTRAFLSQALDHGVFHADLHEGNLFVSAPDVITAVDFGIIGRLGHQERRYLAEILWGFLQRDYLRVAQVHFDAGYVPGDHPVETFAQALRAVGEPIFGLAADKVSMGRLLSQLFEITALFDMKLRPELVLLQKTMVTVEGVARRIDPAHDLWAAADPITRRWIARELSPPAQIKRLLAEGQRIIEGLARHAGAPPATSAAAPMPKDHSDAAMGFAVGALVAGLAFVLAALLR